MAAATSWAYHRDRIMLDSSALIAARVSTESNHRLAQQYLQSLQQERVRCFVLNETTHETYTRIRYDIAFDAAIGAYEELRKDDSGISILEYSIEDEQNALGLLKKYDDKKISFHDALCAAVMMRNGIHIIFTFDSDFWSFGFWVVPGI